MESITPRNEDAHEDRALVAKQASLQIWEESGHAQDPECGPMKTVSDLLSETDWEDAVDDSLKTIAESNTELVPNDNGTMDENLNPIYEDQDPFHGFESPGAAPHSQDMEQIHESPPHLRPKRISKQPKRIIEDPNFLSICDSALISSDFDEPTSYQEASLSPQAEEWKAAMLSPLPVTAHSDPQTQ
ncbi:hypothetical protein DAPPUDRAFT_333994 [Daphnia pulex]|uniref:Uncharacterized protein n=1 Tax=Daphnia pulex TaxID=6669 RepID=E9HUE2_DAPPU|nr:hypothetical protein DAPPUDRAFT_333994 [Daphnia pulex]|eukprot:EFX64635.1 hypothetical protein DAPPUDRAFT_333994 [Daphnia pulex]